MSEINILGGSSVLENTKQEAYLNQDVDQNDDVYAYLERDFSSENFKIEVKNMPKYYGINEFRKLLNEKLKLNSNKIKPLKKNSSYAFVCFRNEEDREKALMALSQYNWKGKKLQAIKAKPAPDPLVKKRKQEAEDSISKKQKVDNRSQEEKLKDSVIPYWRLEYSEQLKLKQNHIEDVMKKLGNELAHNNPELQKWIQQQKAKYDGLPCELEEIRYSEQIDSYRNKCEFTVGIDETTKLPTVGFRIGSYVKGKTGVGSVDDLVHIPQSMKVAVKVFEEYVRSSDLSVFNPEFNSGHFRQIMIRSAPTQLMIVVGIHPQNLSDDKLDEFKKNLVDYFSLGNGSKAKITSLYYQKLVKKKDNDDIISTEHLWGDTHIYESLFGLQFRISPEAFFQINTKGAEVLYKSAIELAKPVENSTVLDVCCGTGTIGLCFAKDCNQVLGIELIPQAIIDAQKNVEINNIENAQFFTGKAEEILGDICFKATNSNVIVVVDPPRAGLHRKAILQIRKIPKINKLIFVSCNPSAALLNFVDFGRSESKKVHGAPFVPTKAIAVDMFPYTKHCELVVCFERWNSLQIKLETEHT